MPILPEVIDFIWLMAMLVSFGAVTSYSIVRNRVGLFWALVFLLAVLFSGAYWWEQNYELYEAHKSAFGTFYVWVGEQLGWITNNEYGVDGQAPSYIESRETIVKEFYNALGHADGLVASNLVIPEKRESGPFAVANINKFFGSLRSPLVLEATQPLPDDRVRASYSYVGPNGVVCSDTATVTLTLRRNAWLIATIVPDGRC